MRARWPTSPVVPGARSRVGLETELRQTNSESELIGWLHEAADAETPVVLNPAAFTHYSYAVRDACAHPRPLVEVHLSNPAARESSGTPAWCQRLRPGRSPGSVKRPTRWR